MSANRTRSIQTTIRSINNTVKVINVITDVYALPLSDVMESIKCSIDELNNLKFLNSAAPVKPINDIDVDELFTNMLTDLINNMPDNRKFVGISELTQAINEIISNQSPSDKYSFKISNMLLSMDPKYIKSLKEIFKTNISSKMININYDEIFVKCRCRKNIDGLKDKWVIKFK